MVPWKGITAALAAALIIGLGLLALLQDEPTAPRPATPAAKPATPAAVPIAPPLPRLDRRQIIRVAAVAADATAAGIALPDAARSLVGRNFTIRLPFGCDGPTPRDAKQKPWASWSYDPKRRALRLTARPEQWGGVGWVQALADGMPLDAVEGFWVERPWTSAETCPPVPPPPSASESSEDEPDAGTAKPSAEPAATQAKNEEAEQQTLALAQFFGPESRRTLRRGGRPYSVTLKQEAGLPDGARYYNLVLSGRIAAFPDNQPVHCRDNGPTRRPTCVVAIEYTNVAFEDPSDGKILEDWGD